MNRAFIKKEFEFKQYQKGLMEELAEEKRINKKLQGQLSKYNDLMHHKEFEIQHLNNQKKMLVKDKKGKEVITMETQINDNKLNQNNHKQTGTNAIQKHTRQKSDELTSKRAATAHSRKKSSITKR